MGVGTRVAAGAASGVGPPVAAADGTGDCVATARAPEVGGGEGAGAAGAAAAGVAAAPGVVVAVAADGCGAVPSRPRHERASSAATPASMPQRLALMRA